MVWEESMTREEFKQRKREINNEITTEMNKEIERMYDIYMHDDEHPITKIEKVVASYDLANLALTSALADLSMMKTLGDEDAKGETNIIGVTLGLLIERLEKIVSKYLAPDTKMVYMLHAAAFSEEDKDVNMLGNPVCSTTFYKTAFDKLKEIERLETEVVK
jgi:hypothetical protein